jgi:hypothetical protein
MSPRLRFLGPLVIGTVCLLSAPAAAGGPQIEKTLFGTGAKVGFGLLKYHHTCIWFRVLFISGDFFKELREQETPNGIEFRKKKSRSTYTSFPDPLIVDVEAIPWKCSTEETPPDYASGLMKAPSFEVSWKGRDETRRVELLATEEHHLPRWGLGWSYLLTVPSTSVPLTDSLAIDVSLRHGICQMHLTASLDPRESHMTVKICD